MPTDPIEPTVAITAPVDLLSITADAVRGGVSMTPNTFDASGGDRGRNRRVPRFFPNARLYSKQAET